jgi:hypothetical protein
MSTTSPEPPLQQVITDLFQDYKGDETGGKHAFRGFSFQVWHAVLETLRAHTQDGDYAVVLEWQQDVAVLNSATQPTKVRFIQLKKNESSLHWKLANLIAPEKAEEEAANDAASTSAPAADDATGTKSKAKKPKKPKKPKPSILGKLYVHRRRFQSLAQARLEFVSDAQFEVPDGAGGKQIFGSFELSALDPAVRAELEQKLREQLELSDGEAVDLNDFGLVVSECPVSEPHRYVAGALVEMQLTSEMQLSGKATMLAVLVIASYLNLRAGKLHHAKNLDELLKRAVTRSEVAEYLTAANDHTVPTQDRIQEVVDRLNAEQAPFGLVTKMRREVTRACVDITNRASPAPMAAAYLKALYQAHNEYDHLARVTDQLAAWYEDFQKLAPPDARLYKREYLYCLMAMISQDANPTKHLPPVPSGSQPEDGQ